MSKRRFLNMPRVIYSTWPVILVCMFLPQMARAQDMDDIRVKFSNYAASHYQEKVFLHIDKTVYSTGDIIWFKAYVTNATSNRFSLLSKVAYVELLNAENKPMLQAKISIDSGNGTGSFFIPASLRTGNYVVRAYTNWMKNYDPSLYFHQVVCIININKKAAFVTPTSPSLPLIQFFPEGGNLVDGLQNTVAFKITDSAGKGLDAQGTIVDDKNEKVADFKSQHLGMGRFSFTPQAQSRYHAVFAFANKAVSTDLPQAAKDGWILQLTDQGNNLSLKVSTGIRTENTAYLLIQSRDSGQVARVQSMSNGMATFEISKEVLAEGISQITIFNGAKQPVCERLYFKRPLDILTVRVAASGQTFQERKPVNIDVQTAESAGGLATGADLSAAVFLIDSLQPLKSINILNYLWLTSSLQGNIEDPQYYFENTGAEATLAADNLMLTQGWRRFKWLDILSGAAAAFDYLPEAEGQLITGKVTSRLDGSSRDSVHGYLSLKGGNSRFAASTSNSAGAIRFNIENFYGSNEIITQTSSEDSNYRISIDNPYSESYSDYKAGNFKPGTKDSSDILLRSIASQVQNSYQPALKQKALPPQYNDTTGAFGLPSKTYYLDDYTRFPTMEEVMREYVKEVHVKNRQKKFHFEVFNENEINNFQRDALVFTDGAVVSDVDKIINMDPLKIKKVDIFTSRVFFNQQQYDGVVSYSTYNQDLEGYPIDPNTLIIEYEGLQLEREFYSPQYATGNPGRIPDYRNTLFWEPDLKTDSAGKGNFSFFTSDVPGKYLVVVQGLSGSGSAGISTTTFSVVQ